MRICKYSIDRKANEEENRSAVSITVADSFGTEYFEYFAHIVYTFCLIFVFIWTLTPIVLWSTRPAYFI